MDDSVGFLLQNLKDLVLYQTKLIGDAREELNGLNSDLDMFRAVLVDASRKYKKDEIVQEWERKIREAVYDIEDAIDTCVTKASGIKTGKRNWLNKLSSKGAGFAEVVKHLRNDIVKPLMHEFHTVKLSPADELDTVVADARRTRQMRSSHIVGFEEEARLFVDQLTRESDHLEIFSVVGMPGLGKTTFAWKLFEDPTIQFEFPALIWVNVSENLNMRKVLLDILLKFTGYKPDTSVTDEQLLKVVKDHLAHEKFLMVLDDIWTVAAWRKLKAVLPTNNKWGRVLITTTQKDVGYTAATARQLAHDLRFLSAKESWDLLQYKVFGKLDEVPRELVGVGRAITIECKGLPLSIVVIGGILEEKTSKSRHNITAVKNEWNKVSKSVNSYLVEGDGSRLLGSIISLSYENLPYQLRNCFLYLGVFPEDADIPVKKLIRLWIAEGFVQGIEGKKLEEVAHDNLNELINRNLVMVRVAKPSGEAKICHVHDAIREICKREGGYRNLNLFQEIGMSEPLENIENFRRICIHSSPLDLFSRKPNLMKARSFLCFSESPLTLETKEVASVANTFALLRVYDAENMKFQRFPSKFLQQLDHLRYLTLSIHDVAFKALPEIVMDLWNLQTLIVDTPSEILDVKGDMLKMRHLRHFKTRASIILRKIGDGEGCKELQTLSRLSPESCTSEVCKKVRGLLTLGIQGDLSTLADSRGLGDLNSLHKLKLVHQVRRGTAENPWRLLPDPHGFPPNLKILVLKGTRLDWAKMHIFSAMGSLEELKLQEYAFHGTGWRAAGSGFSKLIYLHIDRADLRLWEASDDHFPELRFLYIINCEKLLGIPSTLGKSLEVLRLERVSVDAVQSAQEIVNDQWKLKRAVRLEIAAADKRQN